MTISPMRVLQAVIYLFVVSFPSTAMAAMGSEEGFLGDLPLVMSASFFEIDQSKTAGSSYLITNEQLENSSVRTMYDVFETFVPGYQMNYHLWTGPLIGSRGVSYDSNSKTLFLLDNQPINQRRHYGVTTELNTSLFGDIDRIEIMQGPVSTVHGSGTINGYVNFIPKTGRKYQGLSVSAEAGFVEQLKKVEAGYGKDFGNADVYVYVGALNSKGFRPTSTTQDKAGVLNTASVAGGNPLLEDHSYPNYKACVYLNSGNLKLNMFHFSYWDSTNFFSNWFGGVYDLGWYHAGLGMHPEYTINLTEKDDLTLSANVLFYDAGFWDKGYDSVGERGELWCSKEASYRGQVVYKTIQFPGHSFAAGFNYGFRRFPENDAFFSEENSPNGWESANMWWNEFAFFTEDLWRITNKLNLSLGLRYDAVRYSSNIGSDAGDHDIADRNHSHTAPRVAGAYQLTDNSNIRLSYQQGFRWPDAAQIRAMVQNNEAVLGLIQSSVVLGQHQYIRFLKPEIVNSYELNYTHSLMNKKMTLDVNLYYNGYKNFLVYNNAEGTVVNVDFASSGGECIVNYEVTPKTDMMVSFAQSRPQRFTEDDFYLFPFTNTARDKWTCTSPYQFKAQLSQEVGMLILSADVQYYSALDHNSGAYRTLHDPAIWANVSARLDLASGAMIKFVGKNIFRNEAPNAGWMTGYPPLAQQPLEGQSLYYVTVGHKF